MMPKYTHASAYFPDFCHGSTVEASTSSGGLVALQQGIKTLFLQLRKVLENIS